MSDQPIEPINQPIAPAQLLNTMSVRTPDGSYPIYIGAGAQATLPDLLSQHHLRGQAVIVTNRTLATLYGEALAAHLDAPLMLLPEGEQYKTLDSIRVLYDQFAAAQLDRDAIIIALGGGVIGDMAGFAAATYLRGLTFVQMPTSLLSMVDASVGGKVGVDLPQGKNLVGAFKQPAMVVIDTDVLASLPDAERRSGLAEVIKHGLIADPTLLDTTQYARLTPDFITRAIQVKVGVVERDPYEHNIRAFLNLGHTFGHALETVSGYQWRHGEAVAVGLIGAARLSQARGLCDPELPAQVARIVAEAGLPGSYQQFTPAAIRAAMNADKKRASKRLRFVLLRAVGDPLLVEDVPDDQVLAVLETLRTPDTF